jgi:hypothetical protein
MTIQTLRVFDIGAVDELCNLENIVSVYNIYYDAVIDKVIEIIVLYNTDVNETKTLIYHEDIIEGAIEIQDIFWEDLNLAKQKGEIVLLEGDESLANSLINLRGSFIQTSDVQRKDQ